MRKHLLIFLFSSFLGIISAPDYLTASDSVSVTGINNANIFETVIEEPEAPEETETTVSSSDSASESTPAPAPRANYVPTPTPASAPAPEKDYIRIAGRKLDIVSVDSTTVNSGNHVNKYGEKFLYGHNTSSVFGGLANLGVGDTFSVNYNGVLTNYRISKIVLFEKNSETGKLQLNGSGSYMNQVAKAKSDGVSYGLSIMTCAGTSYGNGDASHRLVLFADAI